MKKFITTVSVLLISYWGITQSLNMIPNPSFEDFSNCPTFLFQIERATPWFSPNQLSAGYYNSCSNNIFPPVGVPYNNGGCNYLIPKSGDAYAGIYAEQAPDNWRTYLEVKLTEPLQADKSYHAGFWICFNDCLFLAMDMVGMYFSVDSVWCPQNQIPPVYLINAVPQVSNAVGNVLTDTANWTLISGYFKANGGEQYLVIGNFYPWNQTTWYWTQMQGYPRAYYFIDDVFVYEDSLTTRAPQQITPAKTGIRITPNPAINHVSIEIPDIENEYCMLEFYSETGMLIKQTRAIAVNGLMSLSLENIKPGFYLIYLKTEKMISHCGKLVIIK